MVFFTYKISLQIVFLWKKEFLLVANFIFLKHFTIQACADKLKREMEEYGFPPLFPDEEEEDAAGNQVNMRHLNHTLSHERMDERVVQYLVLLMHYGSEQKKNTAKVSFYSFTFPRAQEWASKQVR